MATAESVPDPEIGRETPVATQTAGSANGEAPAEAPPQVTQPKKEEEKAIHHRDDGEGVVGIVTAFVLAIPVRFLLDLVHIIWLAVILQRYAKSWPDGMSQGGAKNIDGAGACIKLFDYERKMLVAEIVLFTIDLPTIGAACFAAWKMGNGLDEATLYSVVALTPSYLVRIGMSVGGMYWANVAWDQDRGKCTDLWYGGVGLFVIAAGFVIWAWVCIVIYDFWKQYVKPSQLDRAMPWFVPSFIREYKAFALWLTYQWHILQLLSYATNFAQCIQLVQKYREGEKNPIFGQAALPLSIINCILFVLTTLLSWFGARFIPYLMMANTNTSTFEFLTYFVERDDTVGGERKNIAKNPLSYKRQLYVTAFLGVSWFILNFLLSAADMFDGFQNVGNSKHGKLYAVLLIVQQVQSIVNTFLQAIGSVMLPLIIVLNAVQPAANATWAKLAIAAMSKMDVLEDFEEDKKESAQVPAAAASSPPAASPSEEPAASAQGSGAESPAQPVTDAAQIAVQVGSGAEHGEQAI